MQPNGDADAIVPIEGSGQRTHLAVPHSTLVRVPGAPHGFNVSHATVFNEALRSFDQSAIRCEFPPTSGETSIRLSDHPLFRVLRDMRDNVVLTVNVIERRILPYPNGSIEIIARSESALAPVIVRN